MLGGVILLRLLFSLLLLQVILTAVNLLLRVIRWSLCFLFQGRRLRLFLVTLSNVVDDFVNRPRYLLIRKKALYLLLVELELAGRPRIKNDLTPRLLRLSRILLHFAFVKQ